MYSKEYTEKMSTYCSMNEQYMNEVENGKKSYLKMGTAYSKNMLVIHFSNEVGGVLTLIRDEKAHLNCSKNRNNRTKNRLKR